MRYKDVVVMISQIGEQGKDWIDAAVDGGGWERSTAKEWYKIITGLDVSGVELPEGFEAYKCITAKGDQPFTIWKYEPPIEEDDSGVRLVKGSDAPADLDAYSLEGAEYQVYEDAACTKKATTAGTDSKNALFVTDENGNSTETLSLEEGEYYLKEIKAPKGHMLDSTPISFTVSSKGATDPLKAGDAIDYTATRVGVMNSQGQTAVFSSGVFTGTCRQRGTPLTESGSGTVQSRVDNNSKIAKVVYKYGISEDWWQSTNSKNTAKDVLGLNYNTSTTFESLIECACQIDSQGESEWLNIMNDTFTNTTTNKAILNWYKGVDVSGVTVPDNFEMYRISTPAGVQQFSIWALKEKGKPLPVLVNATDKGVYGRPNLRVFKVGDTENFDPTALNGAEFTIKYYDVDDKADIASAEPERTWKFTTTQKAAPQGSAPNTYWAGFDWMTDEPVNLGEESNEFYEDDAGNRVMPIGWFTIEETKAPIGFKINTNKYYGQVKIASDGQSATTVIEGAKDDIQLHMETLTVEEEAYTTTISKKNSATGAELAGAKLQVLKGSTVVVPTWTTTTTPKVIGGLAAGTYTLREIEAPYGYEVADDVTFTVDGKSDKTVEMSNTPVTIKTTAIDASTGTHIGSRKTSSKITDTVHMTGLVKDRKYRLTGTLMNKRTGQAVPNVTVSPKEFTATAATMDVTMDFTFDSTALAEGDSVVVYETLHRITKVHSDETVPKELQKHQDINDKDQTILYPSISTTAIDQTSGTQNLLAGPGATIRDTVSYKGLEAGNYTLEGELYDKTAGKLTGIKKTATFKAESANGTTTMDFTFDATAYAGHTLVVYETLKQGNPGTTTLVEHKNPNDSSQTIWLPDVKTTLLDNKTNEHISNTTEAVTVTDTVECKNLIKGKTYQIKGKLVYQDTGNDVLDNGKTVTATTEFTAKDVNETHALKFTFNGSALEGKTVVAFEDLYTNNKKVGVHADLTDNNQLDHFPKIRTTALDSETKDHIANGDEQITIHDTVSYENLIPNKTYTVTGTLMDKTSGQAVSGVTSQPVEFKPDKANGTVIVDFVFNGKDWQNHKTVAFEKLYLGTKAQIKADNIVAIHENLNDVDQTVHIPEIGTTLVDSETRDHIAFGDSSVTLKDTVAYKNLLVGKEYVATGKLVDKSSGEPIKVDGKEITASTTFTAKSENGSVEVIFKFNGVALQGKTVVAFETVTYKNVPVAVHANINDKDQSVLIPKIGTTAGLQNDFKEVKDVIAYENLLEGRKYVFRGWLVDTATGAKIPGSDGKVDLTATAANVNGSVKMEMNTEKYDDMYGHSMTAYEELYVIEKINGKDTEVKVAEHKDRTGDQNTNPQTIEIYQDLKVKKNVTGNLGDRTKVFEYTAVFTDLVPGATYTVEGDDAKTFKAGTDGKATAAFKLKDDQSVTIKQLPKSATYRITETASDHVHEYKMFSEDMAKKGAKIVQVEGTNKEDAAKALATALETVDLFDGTVVVFWQNNRDLATTTGIVTHTGIWFATFAGLMAALGFVIYGFIKRKRIANE